MLYVAEDNTSTKQILSKKDQGYNTVPDNNMRRRSVPDYNK